ncbi:hypothetical protein DH86_00001914, partial [Scytalidium sp. 3C]
HPHFRAAKQKALNPTHDRYVEGLVCCVVLLHSAGLDQDMTENGGNSETDSAVDTASAGTVVAADRQARTESTSQSPTVVPVPPLVKPRRPHHKSRTGCLQCKQRKVKCDETKPTCNKCDHYGTTCSYLQTHPLQRGFPVQVDTNTTSHNTTPSSSASNPSVGPGQLYGNQSPNFTILDLELLHFWTSTSAFEFLDFPQGAKVF